MQHQRAELEWRDGRVPVSTRFDDPYFSLENGLDETRHVFLDGNNLQDRLRDRFHVAELGFGTGLNFLATVDLWRATGQSGTFRYTSFEAFPMEADDMRHALSAFPRLAELTETFLDAWDPVTGRAVLPGATLEVISGDARETLKDWDGLVDAWFLDGFSPAKNPEIWSADLMLEVARHTKAGGTAATYTAAGFVRRGLEAAGFDIERTPGFGRKRHMTRALKST